MLNKTIDFRNVHDDPQRSKQRINDQSGNKDAYMEGFHSRTVLSLDEVATRLPEGEKCTPVIMS